jgi:cysteine synthase A
VDTVGSTIFGQPARARLMRGLGSSIHPGNVDHPAFDEVHWVGPGEAVESCRRLARHAFVTGGWSTGATARVAAWVARTEPDSRVLAVFPDGPHRYLDSIYDDGWCARHGLPGRTRGYPVEIPHPRAVEVTRWSRCRTPYRSGPPRPEPDRADPALPEQGRRAAHSERVPV